MEIPVPPSVMNAETEIIGSRCQVPGRGEGVVQISPGNLQQFDVSVGPARTAVEPVLQGKAEIGDGNLAVAEVEYA